MQCPESKQPEDWAWLAAWTADWLREQRLRQEHRLKPKHRHDHKPEQAEASSKSAKGRGHKNVPASRASRNRVRQEARRRRAKMKEQLEESELDTSPCRSFTGSLASGQTTPSVRSERSTQLPSGAEELNFSAESMSVAGELQEASDSMSLAGAELPGSHSSRTVETLESAQGAADDAETPSLGFAARTASLGIASVASELPSDPSITYGPTPSPWSPMKFQPGSRVRVPTQLDEFSEDDGPLARTESVAMPKRSTDESKTAAAPAPLLIPESPGQPRYSNDAYGQTPTPWSPTQRQPICSNDAYGRTPTPWSPIQRGIAEDMESRVWDQVQRSFVEKVMCRNAATPVDLPDLPQLGMGAMLRPRGYELPAVKEELLGSGSFGRVVKVRRSGDGQLFAMKRQFLGDFADDIVPVMREVSILNVLKGACNVVQIEEAFLVRPTTGGAEVWAILEFYQHNLNQMHHMFRHEEAARHVVFQLLLGLNSLHSADIVHRDLKPANVLVELGEDPPRSTRLAICDFGISRSLHGLPEKIPSDGTVECKTPKSLRRTVTTHVTSSYWRAPEMWGWADAGRMSKQDLKSLDVFALGLIWAGLLGGGPVITCDEQMDPAKFRLLEILQKVDRPSDEDLNDLFYVEEEKSFIQRLLAGDVEAILPEMVNEDFPDEQGKRERLLRAPYFGIRKWIWQNANQIAANSYSPAIIESMAKFSYRKRPKVEALLEHELFADLRAASPPRYWAHKQAPHIDDVRDVLDKELEHQMVAARQADELRLRPENSLNEVDRETAHVQASVKRVCNQVRAELGRASQKW